MNKLSNYELRQLLNYNKQLKEKLLLSNATTKEIALIDFYSEIVTEELSKRKKIPYVNYEELRRRQSGQEREVY